MTQESLYLTGETRSKSWIGYRRCLVETAQSKMKESWVIRLCDGWVQELSLIRRIVRPKKAELEGCENGWEDLRISPAIIKNVIKNFLYNQEKDLDSLLEKANLLSFENKSRRNEVGLTVIKTIISENLEQELINRTGKTLAYLAVEMGCPEGIRYLVESGRNLKKDPGYKRAYLGDLIEEKSLAFVACEKNDIDCLKELDKVGALEDIKGYRRQLKDGTTERKSPILMAHQTGQDTALQLLIKSANFVPLVQMHKEDQVFELLENLNPNDQLKLLNKKNEGRKPLIATLLRKDKEKCRRFLQSKDLKFIRDVMAIQDENGNTLESVWRTVTKPQQDYQAYAELTDIRRLFLEKEIFLAHHLQAHREPIGESDSVQIDTVKGLFSLFRKKVNQRLSRSVSFTTPGDKVYQGEICLPKNSSGPTNQDVLFTWTPVVVQTQFQKVLDFRGVYISESGTPKQMPGVENLTYTWKNALDFEFLNLLIGNSPNGALYKYPIEIMANYFSARRNVSEKDAEAFRQLNEIAQNFRLGEVATVLKIKALSIGESTVSNGGPDDHSVVLTINKIGKYGYEITVFNSGYGLEFHAKKEGRKYQPAYRVKVTLKPENVTDYFLKLINHSIKTAKLFYDHLSDAQYVRKSEVIPLDEDEFPLQTDQKSSNCTLECLFALQKHIFGRDSYHESRMELFNTLVSMIRFHLKHVESDPVKVKKYEKIRDELLRKIHKRDGIKLLNVRDADLEAHLEVLRGHTRAVVSLKDEITDYVTGQRDVLPNFIEKEIAVLVAVGGDLNSFFQFVLERDVMPERVVLLLSNFFNFIAQSGESSFKEKVRMLNRGFPFQRIVQGDRLVLGNFSAAGLISQKLEPTPLQRAFKDKVIVGSIRQKSLLLSAIERKDADYLKTALDLYDQFSLNSDELAIVCASDTNGENVFHKLDVTRDPTLVLQTKRLLLWLFEKDPSLLKSLLNQKSRNRTPGNTSQNQELSTLFNYFRLYLELRQKEQEANKWLEFKASEFDGQNTELERIYSQLPQLPGIQGPGKKIRDLQHLRILIGLDPIKTSSVSNGTYLASLSGTKKSESESYKEPTLFPVLVEA